MRVRSFSVALSKDLPEESSRIHAMRCVVRACVYATRLFQVRTEVAGGRLLLDDGFFAAGVLGIVREHFEGMQVDVAVGAIARTEAAADAPVLDDHLEGIATANGPDGAADHAEGIAALAARRGDEIIFEAQAVAHQARYAVVRVGASVHASVAARAIFQVENQQALRFHQALGEELVERDALHHLQAVLVGGAAFGGNLFEPGPDIGEAVDHLAEIVAGYFHDFNVIKGCTGCRADAAPEEADFAEIVATREVREDEFAAGIFLGNFHEANSDEIKTVGRAALARD